MAVDGVTMPRPRGLTHTNCPPMIPVWFIRGRSSAATRREAQARRCQKNEAFKNVEDVHEAGATSAG